MTVLLAAQPAELRVLTQSLAEDHAATRPSPNEWSIKEVLGHINDTERILSYRALRVARGDETALPGFEQDEYVLPAGSNARTVADLLAEFDLIRASTIALVHSLPASSYTNTTEISGGPLSTRALLHIIPGHVANHLESLRTVYKLAAVQ